MSKIEPAEPWWDWYVNPITGWMTENRGENRQRALRGMAARGVDKYQFIEPQ